MNNKNTIHLGIRVDELERQLKTEILRIGEKGKLDTDIAVSQNLSNPSVILDEVTAEIEVLKEEVSKNLNPEIDKLSEEIAQTNIEGIQNVTTVQEEQLNKKIGSTEVDVKRCRLSYDWSKYNWIILAIVALCSIDAAANYSAFQVLTKSLLGAIILTLAVAVGLTYASHVIGGKVQTAPTVRLKRWWFFGGLIGAGVVFLLLGFIRQAYMQSTGFATSPILWMLFNDFFFCIALLLASMKLPTKEQALEYSDLKEKKKQLEQLKMDKETLLSNLSKEEARINECKQKRESFRTYKNGLLFSLDKEKARIHAMCLKEFTLKSGHVPIKTLSISKNTEL